MTQPPVGPPPWDPGPPEYPPYPTYPPVEPYPPYPQAHPSGYPPPGYPPQPSPYGYPTAGTYSPIERARGTNGFAIAALILGIIPICVGILGIIFGFISLNQIKQTGQKGRGMAITGIVFGFLWIVVAAVGIAVGASNSPKRGDTGELTRGGSIDVSKLRVGDCAKDLAGGEGEKRYLTYVDVVPCTEPHKAEVFDSIPLFGVSVPAQSDMDDKGQSCVQRLERYSTSAYEDDSVSVTFITPTRDSWKKGDKSITCVATFPTDRSESIKGQ